MAIGRDMINLTIDGIKVAAEEGTTILKAATKAGIEIPTLCFLKDINEVGDCRMCIVEIEGRRGFATSCVQKVEEGMVVHTNTKNVIDARKTVLELIISNHHRDCLTCIRNKNCELQELASKYGIDNIDYEGEKSEYKIDDKSPSIVRDLNKCILCRRCIGACKNVQGIEAITSTGRGFESKVDTAEGRSLADIDCIYCGQCIEACPTGALYEKSNIQEIVDKINDENVVTIVQTAPAVRAAIGEEFGMEIGNNTTGKMVTALKRLGFNKVFDTNTGADFTVIEEANELIDRIKNNETMPMFTSCCPAWVRYVEKNYPEFIPNLSSCKSPHQMFGSVIKSYYAKKQNIDPKNIFVVSVMPCIAKKFESARPEMKQDECCDVDAVITTRELARMIKKANIDYTKLEDSTFDNPMGDATGAAAIFGVTGGVMEAALRTAADGLEGRSLQDIEYKEVRGEKGIKRATVNIAGKDINVAVASGIRNAKTILEEIKSGKTNLNFVEIMACPGGCIMGGGQPIKSSKIQASTNIKKLRSNCLYTIDEKSTVRKSHENPVIKEIYKEFLKNPGSSEAHKYLHTTYQARKKYEI